MKVIAEAPRQLILPDQEMRRVAEISLTKIAFKNVLKRIKAGSRIGEAYLENKNRRHASEITGYVRDYAGLGRMEDSRHGILGQDIAFFVANNSTLLITEGTKADDFNNDHKELLFFSILPPNIYNINGKMTNESVVYSIQNAIRFVNKITGWEKSQLNLEEATNFVRDQNIKPQDFENYFK